MDRLVHKDRAGNTLWTKDKKFMTVYAKNADGELLRKQDGDEIIVLAKRQGKLPGVRVSEFREVYVGRKNKR